MTAERPILFSGPLVRAILDGRKTETRRPVKPTDEPADGYDVVPLEVEPCLWVWTVDGDEDARIGRCPYGQPGDLLYVRETWQPADDWLGRQYDDPAAIWYRADGAVLDFEHCPPERVAFNSVDDWKAGPWRPSIHMPKWAARIWLRVEEVRVERVQDITEAGARAEGVAPALLFHVNGDDVSWAGGPTQLRSPVRHRAVPRRGGYRQGFAHTWNAINGKRAHWHVNPWVWVVRFSVVSTAGRPAIEPEQPGLPSHVNDLVQRVLRTYGSGSTNGKP